MTNSSCSPRLRKLSPRRSHTGFTLIELLVVISIIALLVGLLLPALGSARAASQSTACLSNQRQIGLGVGMYNADNNGYFPHYGVINLNPMGIPWPLRFIREWQYIPSEGAFVCPAMPNSDTMYNPLNWSGQHATAGMSIYAYAATATDADANAVRQDKLAMFIGTNYGANAGYVWARTSPEGSAGQRAVNETEIPNPSNAYLTLDVRRRDVEPEIRGSWITRVTKAGAASNQQFAEPRHLGFTVNAVFCDGHAEAIAVSNPEDPWNSGLTDGNGNPAGNRWSGDW